MHATIEPAVLKVQLVWLQQLAATRGCTVVGLRRNLDGLSKAFRVFAVDWLGTVSVLSRNVGGQVVWGSGGVSQIALTAMLAVACCWSCCCVGESVQDLRLQRPCCESGCSHTSGSRLAAVLCIKTAPTTSCLQCLIHS